MERTRELSKRTKELEEIKGANETYLAAVERRYGEETALYRKRSGKRKGKNGQYATSLSLSLSLSLFLSSPSTVAQSSTISYYTWTLEPPLPPSLGPSMLLYTSLFPLPFSSPMLLVLDVLLSCSRCQSSSERDGDPTISG